MGEEIGQCGRVMPVIRVTRRVEFDSGHRVTFHKSKCRNLHGHRYRLEVTLEGELITTYGDSSQGMVIDFGDMKELIGKHVVDRLDHAFIVWEEDRRLVEFLKEDGHKHVVVPFVPTAENLVAYCRQQIEELLAGSEELSALKVVRVRLYETPNAWADA